MEDKRERIKLNFAVILQISLLAVLVKSPSVAIAICFAVISIVEAFKDVYKNKAMSYSIEVEDRLGVLSDRLETIVVRLSEVEVVAAEAKANASKLTLANGMRTTSVNGR